MDGETYTVQATDVTLTEELHPLTARRRLDLYLATRDPQAPLGELLRHYDVHHLDDLRQIEQDPSKALRWQRSMRKGAMGGGLAMSRPNVCCNSNKNCTRRLLRWLNSACHSPCSKKRACGISYPEPGQSFPAETQPVILDLVAAAKAQGLPNKRACEMLGLSPRTLQRWRQPTPSLSRAPYPRPPNALYTHRSGRCGQCDPLYTTRGSELLRTGFDAGGEFRPSLRCRT